MDDFKEGMLVLWKLFSFITGIIAAALILYMALSLLTEFYKYLGSLL